MSPTCSKKEKISHLPQPQHVAPKATLDLCPQLARNTCASGIVAGKHAVKQMVATHVWPREIKLLRMSAFVLEADYNI